MWTISNILNKVFDIFFYPFHFLHPLFGLTAISLVTAVVMLLIYKAVSNQKGIEIEKNKIKGYVLEVLLYSHEFKAMLEAQKNILKHNFLYMKHAIVPMLVMIIPIILIIVQIQARYGYLSFKPGDNFILTLKFKKELPLHEMNVALNSSKGIEIQTPVLRIQAERMVCWRAIVTEPGIHQITFCLKKDREKVIKKIVVGKGEGRFSSTRSQRSFSQGFLNPAEPPLPAFSLIESISVNYPVGKYSIFGWRIHWLGVFFVFTIIFGFGLKDLFGVKI